MLDNSTPTVHWIVQGDNILLFSEKIIKRKKKNLTLSKHLRKNTRKGNNFFDEILRVILHFNRLEISWRLNFFSQSFSLEINFKKAYCIKK